MASLAKYGSLLLALSQVASGCNLDVPTHEGRILAGGSDYDYSRHGALGPKNWASLFDGCAGVEQSPIDLPKIRDMGASSDASVAQPLTPSYMVPTESSPLSISKGKFGITVSYANHLSTLTTPELSGLVGRAKNANDENQDWVLEQFHFHWDQSNSKGSEHRVNGKAHELEVHLVHRNAKYASLGDAVGEQDGLLVVGRFFNVVRQCKVNKYNTEIDTIADTLRDAVAFDVGDSVEIEGQFDAMKMLTDGKGWSTSLDNYYTYAGGLTTPGCNEAVTWVVLSDVGEITRQQMQAFRDLENDDNVISRNWRPTQPLNARTVYHSSGLEYSV